MNVPRGERGGLGSVAAVFEQMGFPRGEDHREPGGNPRVPNFAVLLGVSEGDSDLTGVGGMEALGQSEAHFLGHQSH